MNKIMLLAVAGLVLFISCGTMDPFDAMANKDYAGLEKAISGKGDINAVDKDGKTLLQMAMKYKDTTALKIVLDNGADVNREDKEGKSVLVETLDKISRRELTGGLGGFMSEAGSNDDPDDFLMKAMVMLMEAYRSDAYNSIDIEGKLSVSMEYHGFSAQGIQLVAVVTLSTDEGEYQLALSRRETDYTGVEKTGGKNNWNVVLKPGGIYHVAGDEKDGEIEVTLLELVTAPEGDDSMVLPMTHYLPSTWELMQTKTWMKDLLK